MMQKTGLQDGDCTLDWLSFSLPYEDGLAIVESIFGKGELRDRGIRGYSHSATLPCGGSVSWCPDRPDMKVHTDLSSKQLALAFELQPALTDVPGFLKFLVSQGATFSRVDFAWDDRIGLLNMETINEHVRREWLTSRWRNGRYTVGRLQTKGETHYFGSRGSASFLRIYDKQLQLVGQGEDDPGHWIRAELELKKIKALSVIVRYLMSSEHYLRGVLRGLLEFREPTEDETKSRWPICSWWGEFLDWSEAQQVGLPKAEPSIERDLSWADRQWPRTMARILEAKGGDTGWLYDLAEKGRTKLSPADYQRVKAYIDHQSAKQEETEP